MDEEPAEDVVRRAPELRVVALDDVTELVPEGRSIWTLTVSEMLFMYRHEVANLHMETFFGAEPSSDVECLIFSISARTS